MKVQRFLFETSFDGNAAAAPFAPADLDTPDPEEWLSDQASEQESPSEEHEPAAPTLSERDLVEAKAAAFAEGEARGREAALAEAAGSLEQRCSELLEQIATALPDSLRAEEDAYSTACRESLGLAKATFKKLFPRLERQAALAEVEALVEASLAQLRQEPRVVLRLPDDLLDPMRDRLDALTHRHGFEGKVVLLADPEMGPSDVRVEFADGGMERCARQLWSEIESRILEAGTHSETPAEDPAKTPAEAQVETPVETPASPPSSDGQDQAA